jgi:hypothetical protein
VVAHGLANSSRARRCATTLASCLARLRRS